MKKEKRTLKDRRKDYRAAVKMELREHKSSFIVYSMLRIIVIASMIRQFFLGNYEGFFLCILTLLLLMLPSLIQVQLKIELPTTLEIIILLFIFAAEILGEINAFYELIPLWDTILHTLNGFLAAAIGFSLAVLLNDSERLTFDLSPVFLAIVAFCFSMTIGVLWEFFECAMDLFFHLDMQKDTIIHSISSVMLSPAGSNVVGHIDQISDAAVNGESLGLGGYLDIGLLDTMKDMFVNFVGAVVFSVIGFFYVRSKGEGRVARRFIPQRKAEDRDYLALQIRLEAERTGNEHVQPEAECAGDEQMKPEAERAGNE
ncbi:hypothetical protein [Hespellia stercorisuis]|uniref:Uncharacterized protein n=1 Tax=Hespellia stercorisuis DSM 15480 TaxID=1121950 RepID=A0A1M6MDX3_9FIRM|nr:hypothetical protein [Hespellia stercorisuis]SHJ81639.1 hypothetical protein SAMN02745243_01445 [Hespellia stercorisuis DSM 15480]